MIDGAVSNLEAAERFVFQQLRIGNFRARAC